MIKITPEEISQFRSELASSPEALEALDAIEECKGNLDAAAQLIAVQTTDEEVSLRGDFSYLETLAQKLSPIICQEEFDVLIEGLLKTAIVTLAANGHIPVTLATSVVIFVAKIGKKQFCETAKSKS